MLHVPLLDGGRSSRQSPSPHEQGPELPRKVQPGLVDGASIAPQTRNEIGYLCSRGLNISAVDVPQRVFNATTRAVVDDAIDKLSRSDGCVPTICDPKVHPTAARWLPLAMRAPALGPMYGAGKIQRLGEGVDPLIFDEPLFPGKRSANELIRELKPEKAESIIKKYAAFFDPTNVLNDGRDERYGLTTNDYLTHAADSYAVRTRANAAMEIIEEHLLRSGPSNDRIVASLACGAAEPSVGLLQKFREKFGVNLRSILVDSDPLPLAMATSLARTNGVEDLIQVHRKDLFRTPVTDYADLKSVDALEMLGFIEYIPTVIRKGPVKFRAAADLLASVAPIVRPNGIIVLSNMLKSRPQQAFFDRVWPPLQQRTISEMLGVIRDAGFRPEDISVHVPKEGIYAIYTINVPEDYGKKRQRTPLQYLAHTAVGRYTVGY